MIKKHKLRPPLETLSIRKSKYLQNHSMQTRQTRKVAKSINTKTATVKIPVMRWQYYFIIHFNTLPWCGRNICNLFFIITISSIPESLSTMQNGDQTTNMEKVRKHKYIH